MKKLALLLAMAMALFAIPCLTEEIVSPGSGFYYYDEPNVLSRDLKGEIYFCNRLLHESPSATACGPIRRICRQTPARRAFNPSIR